MANERYEQTELTLGQIFTVARKALKRGLIYMLITAILATTILFTVKAFTDNNKYTSTISFVEADENTLSTMNYNKSNVVNKALTSSNKPLTLSDSITQNLNVTAITPGNLKDNEEYVPTSYKITLTPLENHKLTSEDYESILDNIAKEFINTFAISTFPNENYSYNITEELANVEYLKIADELAAETEYYFNLFNSVLGYHPSVSKFVDTNTGKTLGDIVIKLKSLDNTIEAITQVIITKRVENIDNLKTYLDWTLSSLQSDVVYYTDLQTKAKEALDAYNSTLSNIVTGNNGNNIYVYDDEGYIELYNNYMKVSSNKAASEKLVVTIQSYITNLPQTKNTDEATDTYVKNKLIEINSTLSSLIEEYKTIAEAYNNSKFVSASANVTQPAHSTLDSKISGMIIVLIDVSLILIAYIVAYIQTYIKLKNAGYFTENKLEAETK